MNMKSILLAIALVATSKALANSSEEELRKQLAQANERIARLEASQGNSVQLKTAEIIYRPVITPGQIVGLIFASVGAYAAVEVVDALTFKDARKRGWYW